MGAAMDDISGLPGAGASGARGEAWCASWRGAGVLFAICVLTLLPGLFQLPPIDRDEARFAQASRQMAETGDWLVPRVQDKPRINKPPLIYHLQASAARLLTGGDVRKDAIWMYRLPGMCCTLLAVLITWRIGCSMDAPCAGLLAGAMLAICPLVVMDAHQARADQLLLVCTTGAQWAAWNYIRTRPGTPHEWLWALLMWTAIILGFFAKGPVTVMVMGLTAATMMLLGRRSRRNVLVHVVGGGILLAVIAAWMNAMMRNVGSDYFLGTIRAEVLGRSVEAKEGHWGPPGYHLVLMVGLFFPGSLVTGLAVVQAIRSGIARHRLRVRWQGEPATLFLLAWVLPAWLVFELVSTKLPHYTMPLYPGLALLTAHTLLRAEQGLIPSAWSRWARAGYALWAVVGLALTITPGAIAWAAPAGMMHPWARWTGVALALIAAALVVSAFLHTRHKRLLRAFFWAAAACVLAIASTLGVVLPAAQHIWLTNRVMERALAISKAESLPFIAAAGYHEDSMIFLSRGKIERIGQEHAQEWLRLSPDRLLILPAEAAATLDDFREIERVEGFNYSRGRWTRLVIGRPAESGAP